MIRFFRRRDALSCREVGRRLQAYLDGEIPTTDAERVRSHLEDCRRCGLEADTYQALIDALARQAEPLPREPVERLREFGRALAHGEPGGEHRGPG